MIRRLGRKTKIVHEIEKYFPKYDIWVEPFFGAGGVFFNKQKFAKWNYLNDNDKDIFNLFNVLKDNFDELIELIEITPYSSDVFKYYKDIDVNKLNNLERALRFLILSNWSYLGVGSNLRFGNNFSKKNTLRELRISYLFTDSCQFNNTNAIDFLKNLNKIDFKDAFIYCDPPYLNTSNNYQDSFTEKQLRELLEYLISKNVKFAFSEFGGGLAENIFKEYGLNIIIVKERRSLKNRNLEILATNYKQENTLF